MKALRNITNYFKSLKLTEKISIISTIFLSGGLLITWYQMMDYHKKWETEKINSKHIELSDSMEKVRLSLFVNEMIAKTNNENRTFYQTIFKDKQELLQKKNIAEQDNIIAQTVLVQKDKELNIQQQQLNLEQRNSDKSYFEEYSLVTRKNDLDYSLKQISQLDSLSPKIFKCIRCIIAGNEIEKINQCRDFLYLEVYNSPYFRDSLRIFYETLVDSVKYYNYYHQWNLHLNFLRSKFIASATILDGSFKIKKNTIRYIKHDSDLMYDREELLKNSNIAQYPNVYDENIFVINTENKLDSLLEEISYKSITFCQTASDVASTFQTSKTKVMFNQYNPNSLDSMSRIYLNLDLKMIMLKGSVLYLGRYITKKQNCMIGFKKNASIYLMKFINPILIL